jgi:purine-nucleoside phosphorylase
MSVHIGAKKGEIAERILLPGDPLRAKFIAEEWFSDVHRFNEVRGMLGFTGTWRGERLSVMGTGMGQPSLSIYVNELLSEYGVRKLVRVGTCGSTRPDIKVRDVILGMSACTDSGMNRQRFGFFDYAPAASFPLLSAAWKAGNELFSASDASGRRVHAGIVGSVDAFYHPAGDAWKLWSQYGVLGLEMESAELYTLAAKANAEALAILTVSDNIATGEATSAEERQTSFRDMVDIALASIVA